MQAVNDPTLEVTVPRIAVALALVATMLGFAAPSADAATSSQLESALVVLWTKVFDTPADKNPVVGPEGNPCWDLGGIVAPFAANPVDACTVKPGTKIFIAGFTNECSTYPGDTCSGPTATDKTLADDARSGDLQQAGGAAPTMKLDGTAVPFVELLTSVQTHVLPAGNVFGAPQGTSGRFVAHGWVALLHPLTPGTHTIKVTSPAKTYTTKIIVKPGE
jgi:hypothetical protein